MLNYVMFNVSKEGLKEILRSHSKGILNFSFNKEAIVISTRMMTLFIINLTYSSSPPLSLFIISYYLFQSIPAYRSTLWVM